MAKLNLREARQATIAAEQKRIANEAAARQGTTVEEIIQDKPVIKPAAEPPAVEAPKETVKRAGGRPTTAKAKTQTVNFRITQEQSDKINEWVYLKKGTDRSDVVRQALDLLFGE